MCVSIPAKPGWRVQEGDCQGTVIVYHNRTFEVTVQWHDGKGTLERLDAGRALLGKVDPTPKEMREHPERHLAFRELQIRALLE